MQISMSCYGWSFKSEVLNEIGTIREKMGEFAKATDFNRNFPVTSTRFSKIIGRIFVVQGLILNFIKKLTEKNENKFQTFNLENCAYFGVASMENNPHFLPKHATIFC